MARPGCVVSHTVEGMILSAHSNDPPCIQRDHRNDKCETHSPIHNCDSTISRGHINPFGR